MKKLPSIIIFGGDNYNTLGMIRTLGEQHISFESIIIRNTFTLCSNSKYIKRNDVIVVDSIEAGYQKLLEKRPRDGGKAFILVEGDNLTGFLDRRYDELKNDFIWNNAGSQGRLSLFLDKKAQIDLVKEFGINVLPSIVVKKGTVPENLEYPVMTKAITSEMASWKSEVHVCFNRDELLTAFSQIKSEEILIQKYIRKKNELCLDGYSINHGQQQFISIATSYNYLLDDGYSYYATITNFCDKGLQKTISDIMKKVGYEGIYCIEFIIDENDVPYFLEINFRNSGWSYASTCAGMPLPTLWIESMMSNHIDASNIKEIPDNFTFISDVADYKTRAGKMVSYSQWLKEYKNCNCKLILGKNDSKPFCSYLLQRLILKIMNKLKR